MAERRYLGALLHQAEEDEARTNRETQPAEGVNGQSWIV